MTGPHRVVITGLGVVSAIGLGRTAFWNALAEGRSAIRAERVECDGLGVTFPVAPVSADYDAAQHFTSGQLLITDPFAQFAIVAAREAMIDAGLPGEGDDPSETAVILGCGGGGEHARQETAVRIFSRRKLRLHPALVPKTNLQASVGLVSIEHRATGPSFVVSTGCAAATHAIAQAYLTVKHGLATRAITGGSEAPVMLSILQAFDAAGVLSRTTCRPFSRGRDGMVLADGAGIVILETLESARARGAQVYAELAGVGMSADASSAVHPDEPGPARAITVALADAGLNPGDVHYINAHGTGTEVNDRVEMAAVKRVFGSDTRVPISSTKSMHGHAFGGAGGVELVATLLAMRHGVLPPTANYLGPDERCDLDCVPNTARDQVIDVAIKQSFAFGGLNAVLALKRNVSLA